MYTEINLIALFILILDWYINETLIILSPNLQQQIKQYFDLFIKYVLPVDIWIHSSDEKMDKYEIIFFYSNKMSGRTAV